MAAEANSSLKWTLSPVISILHLLRPAVSTEEWKSERGWNEKEEARRESHEAATLHAPGVVPVIR